jgi:hypothetical protein
MGTNKGSKWNKYALKQEKDKSSYRGFSINNSIWAEFNKLFKGNKSGFITSCIVKYIARQTKKK